MGVYRSVFVVAALAVGCGGRASGNNPSAASGTNALGGSGTVTGSGNGGAGATSGATTGSSGLANSGGTNGSGESASGCDTSLCSCQGLSTCGLLDITVCTDVRIDSNNCGACAHQCGPGQNCQAGTCVPLLDASADASDDGTAPSEAGDSAGTPPKCASNSIAFDLTVDATGPVYYSGPQGQGWLDSFGCPSWFAIAPAGEPALNLVKGGCAVGCPATRP